MMTKCSLSLSVLNTMIQNFLDSDVPAFLHLFTSLLINKYTADRVDISTDPTICHTGIEVCRHLFYTLFLLRNPRWPVQ
jgi:hypothetical protein